MSRPQPPLVYVVEDSQSSGALYCSQLEGAGYVTRHFTDGYSALIGIKETMPDAILQDVCLPDITGIDVLQFVNRQQSPAPVVLITSNSSIEIAVDAMRHGGFDFIEKPFSSERLISSVENAIKNRNITASPTVNENDSKPPNRSRFIGDSLTMNTIFRLLESASRSKASVFITGESGTGKEVCAMTLHDSSPRSKMPFIAINCAAIPGDLFESEFFGHVKGAFSGALSDRKGAVEVAAGGTLFLDEICEMDINLQAKLLRFLQTGTFTRVGSSEPLHSDVRIVCATNRNPAEEVGQGRFREDLYYRLNVIPVKLPPLRDRGEDVLLLARHLLCEKAQANQKTFTGFTPEVEQLFMNYDWPGNIREMQNVIENMVVINSGEWIDLSMLPSGFGEHNSEVTRPARQPIPADNNLTTMGTSSKNDIVPLHRVERNAIEHAISACDNNIPLAAAYLGISASTIYRKIKSWESEDSDMPQKDISPA
ncbi:MAG TPA: sigma-54-dependent Fis family transcriptional regulator [Porticoccaceae bacterium]|nr:sigma-54-dependent Fis family transcriptional regulator [Porticoccaceae bacterium]